MCVEGIARVYHHGTYHLHSALVMELLGPSLEVLFTKCRRFTIKTVTMIALQLVSRPILLQHKSRICENAVFKITFFSKPDHDRRSATCQDAYNIH